MSASGVFIRALPALCFEIFFLETFQKRLTAVRSSKADSQPKVVARASPAHTRIHLRRRNNLMPLYGVEDVVSNACPQTKISEPFSCPYRITSCIVHAVQSNFKLQGGLRSTREWPFKLRRDRTGRRRVSVRIRYSECHRNADFKDLIRLFVRRCVRDISLVFHQSQKRLSWCFIRPNTAKARTTVRSSPRNTAYLLNHSVSRFLHTNVSFISIF